MEELICVVKEEFSWTSIDTPLTPVEGTKQHSAVVLIFLGGKNKSNYQFLNTTTS